MFGLRSRVREHGLYHDRRLPNQRRPAGCRPQRQGAAGPIHAELQRRAGGLGEGKRAGGTTAVTARSSSWSTQGGAGRQREGAMLPWPFWTAAVRNAAFFALAFPHAREGAAAGPAHPPSDAAEAH